MYGNAYVFSGYQCIPNYLMNSDIEKALNTFRQMEEFLYIEFDQGAHQHRTVCRLVY